jgi:hypothetical protein
MRERIGSCTLLVNGRACGLRLRRAGTWWARLIGFWPAPRFHAVEVIEFSRCKAIHTFAMSAPLDVAFVDEHGRVLRVVHALPPWRAAFEPQARAVFEFPAGVAQGLGVEPGARLGASTRQRGSATLEFVLAAALVLLPLVTGILEFAQLATARQILEQATHEAARSAAINVMDAGGHPDSSAESLAIRLSLARGLLPLFGGRSREPSRLAEITLETIRPDRVQVSIDRDLLDAVDVVVDRVEVTYCRELFFAPASYLLPELMRLWTVVPFDRVCLESGRVPLRVSAPATRSRYP